MTDKQVAAAVEKTMKDATAQTDTAISFVMKDVESAQKAMTPAQFQEYQQTLTAELNSKGLLPKLSVGYLKSHFDDIDDPQSPGLTVSELKAHSNDRNTNIVEQAFTNYAKSHFSEMGGNRGGGVFGNSADNVISKDELKEQASAIDKQMDDAKQAAEKERIARESANAANRQIRADINTAEQASKILADNGGALFRRIGVEDGNAKSISRADLQAFIAREEKLRTVGVSNLGSRELSFLKDIESSWDKGAGKILRGTMEEITVQRVANTAKPAIDRDNAAAAAASNHGKEQQKPVDHPVKKEVAKPAAPKPGDKGSGDLSEYTVKAGQGYWQIAKDILTSRSGGEHVSAKSVQELAKKIQEDNPGQLHPKQKVKVRL